MHAAPGLKRPLAALEVPSGGAVSAQAGHKAELQVGLRQPRPETQYTHGTMYRAELAGSLLTDARVKKRRPRLVSAPPARRVEKTAPTPISAHLGASGRISAHLGASRAHLGASRRLSLSLSPSLSASLMPAGEEAPKVAAARRERARAAEQPLAHAARREGAAPPPEHLVRDGEGRGDRVASHDGGLVDQVPTDAWQTHLGSDAVRRQLVRRPDARQQQQVRGRDRARAQQHLPASTSAAAAHARRPLHARCVDVLHPDRTPPRLAGDRRARPRPRLPSSASASSPPLRLEEQSRRCAAAPHVQVRPPRRPTQVGGGRVRSPAAPCRELEAAHARLGGARARARRGRVV